MQLRPAEVPPERKKLLRKAFTVYNFSDADFTATWDGTTYLIGAHKMRRDLPAGFCYFWFGDPTLRVGNTQQDAKAWTAVVDRIMHKLMVGHEASPKELFFNRYIRTGKIGCMEILDEFSAREKIQFPEDMPAEERISIAAQKYYGAAIEEKREINDGGVAGSFADLQMFGKWHLPDGATVKNMEDGEVIGFTTSQFGTHAPQYQTSGDIAEAPVSHGTANSHGFAWGNT